MRIEQREIARAKYLHVRLGGGGLPLSGYCSRNTPLPPLDCGLVRNECVPLYNFDVCFISILDYEKFMAEEKKKSNKGKSKKNPPPKKSIFWRIFKFCFISGIILAILGCGAIAGVFWYYSRTLPGIFAYSDYKPKQMSIIYDRTGEPILEMYEEKRLVVPFDEIPLHMRQAMIASEDGNFYEHGGVDYIGILRSVYNNIRHGRHQGASTITQQVVKNLLLTPERQLSRKFQEVLLARQIEQALTKDEILTIYLNHVYFGHRNYGVERAALFFFGKHARDLTLNESATIAGLVQSPERLSPKKHPEEAKARRDYVLRRMFESGFINEDTYQTNLKQEIKLAENTESHLGMAPYFTAYVKQMLIAEYGEQFVNGAGLQIYTTLDPVAQLQAEKAFIDGLHNFDNRHYMNRPLKDPSKKQPTTFKKDTNYEAKITKIEGDTVYFSLAGKTLPYTPTPRQKWEKPIDETFKVGQTWFVQISEFENDKPKTIFIPSGANGALVAIEPESREVRALVGGYSFNESPYNRATQALRQTGSSFKTFVYGAALENHVITPTTIIDDAPKVIYIEGQPKPWSPKNSDNKFKGPMTARAALAASRNTIAVDILERTGIEKTKSFVQRLGINTPLVNNLTLALGSTELNVLDVTNAYASIADAGVYKSPVFITKITQRANAKDMNGKELSVKPQTRHVAIAPEVAYVLADMLKSVAVEGTARKYLAKFGRDVGGKTGTTNSTKDAWFVGFTQDLACGIYVGYDDPKNLGKGEGGSTTAVPIFQQFMTDYHKDLPLRNFNKPNSVVEVEVDTATGLLPREPSQKTRKEVFIQGTQPMQQAPMPDAENSQNWMIRQMEAVEVEDNGNGVDEDAF